MRIETILNKCQKFKSFIYKNIRWSKCGEEDCLEAELIPRENSRAICSCCCKPASLYDKLAVRRFEFVPLWGYRFFLFIRCAELVVKHVV